MSTVTISLVTYNSERYIQLFCDSLTSQTYTDWQLIVVDNGSHDASVTSIRDRIPSAKIIKQKENIGFAKAHNLIISWSKSEYILVINHDLIMEPDCLKYLVQGMEEYPDAAEVGGTLRYWDFYKHEKTKIIDSGGLVIERSYRASDRYRGQKITLTKERCFGITGALVLLRRRALESVKVPHAGLPVTYEYFDEDFFAYKEDVDLAWRFILAGWKNYIIPESIAYHHRAISAGAARRTDRRQRSIINVYSYRNHLLMIYKNHYWSVTLRNFFRVGFFEIGKFFYLLTLDGSSLRGLLQALMLTRRFKAKRRHIQSQVAISAAEFRQWLH